MNILVTGGRAPATMDIMRSLIIQGYQVYSAESMLFPLARFVKGVKKHFVIPKPNENLSAFLKSIKEIVIEYKIDILIPTCNEIFHISKGYEELSKHTRVWCEPFDRLNQLHNKQTFCQLVSDYGLEAPLNEPHIAQRIIDGKEYSAYAIAHQGEVLIQSCYHTKYVAGNSTGVYFEPAEIKPITEFIKTFCKRFQFNGQIVFDFILVRDKAYVLECNPRAGSGFHLISDKIDWHIIWGGQRQYDIPNMQNMQPYMLGQGMMLRSLKYLRKNPCVFIKDYHRAHDILKNEAYPWFKLKSILMVFNVLCRAIRLKKGFYPASTYDIDFNGIK